MAKASTPKPNFRPADELLSVRAEIKRLEAREAELRQVFIDAEEGSKVFLGEYAFVSITHSARKTLDRAALVAEFGEDAIEPFMKTTDVTIVKCAGTLPTGVKNG